MPPTAERLATVRHITDRAGTAGEVVVCVRDPGSGRRPPADTGWRGRGMLMIHGLAQRAEVRPSTAGTTVEMRRPLP